jgi:hypothetical protein
MARLMIRNRGLHSDIFISYHFFYKDLLLLSQVTNNSNSEGEVIFVTLPSLQLQDSVGRLYANYILIFTANCFPLNHQTVVFAATFNTDLFGPVLISPSLVLI